MRGNGKDLTGKKFGRLTVIRRESNAANGASRWLCKCECGGSKITTANSLNRGDTRSCGCLVIEAQAVANEAKRGKFRRSPAELVYTVYAGRARKRGLSFELTIPEFKPLITGECHYCGAEPSNHMKRGQYDEFLYSGIDRIDSRYGYVKGNVVSCCKICNRAKGDMAYNEFKKWIQSIADHRVSINSNSKLEYLVKEISKKYA